MPRRRMNINRTPKALSGPPSNGTMTRSSHPASLGQAVACCVERRLTSIRSPYASRSMFAMAVAASPLRGSCRITITEERYDKVLRYASPPSRPSAIGWKFRRADWTIGIRVTPRNVASVLRRSLRFAGRVSAVSSGRSSMTFSADYCVTRREPTPWDSPEPEHRVPPGVSAHAEQYLRFERRYASPCSRSLCADS